MPGEIDQPVAKRARITRPISPLLQYPFLKHLLVPLLSDSDALTRLAISGKVVVSWLSPYSVKYLVTWEQAIKSTAAELYIPLIIQRVVNVKSLDFTALPNLTVIFFDSEFNDHIPPGSIPACVQKVYFGQNFNRRLRPGSIPSSTKFVWFGREFNKPLPPGVIPEGAQEVHFSEISSFDCELFPGSLPSTLKSFTIPSFYSYPLSPGILPSSLVKFKAGVEFDQPLEIGSIPVGVKDVQFQGEFNQLLSHGIIPSTVENLCLSEAFDRSLSPGDLPNSIKTLSFRQGSVAHLVPGSLPESITELELGKVSDGHTMPNGILPQSLRKLVLCTKSQSFKPGFLPERLTHLKLAGDFNCLIVPGLFPDSLTHLIFGDEFENLWQPIKPGLLPSNLVHLEFGSSFDQTIMPGTIPSNVVKLSLGEKFCRAFPPGSIPESVRYIELYRPMLLAWLPPTVTHLTLHIDDEELFSGMIPSHVTNLHLYFDGSRSSSWSNSSSATIKRGPKFSADLIPNTVKYLKMSNLSSLNEFDTTGVQAQIEYSVGCPDDPRLPNWYHVDDPASHEFDQWYGQD